MSHLQHKYSGFIRKEFCPICKEELQNKRCGRCNKSIYEIRNMLTEKMLDKICPKDPRV